MLQKQFPLAQTLQTLSHIDDQQIMKQQCHPLAHYLGSDEYLRTHDLEGTFNICRSQIACGEGCFHGAVEGYLSEHGGYLSPTMIADVCKRESSASEFEYLACNHGLGHALMLQNNGDVVASLGGCDALGAVEREQCYAGVFMENVFNYGSADHPSTEDPSDLGKVCRDLPARYLPQCYAGQASFIASMLGKPFEDVAAFCASVPPQYQTTCYGDIGAEAVVVHDDPAFARFACDFTPEGDPRVACLEQALTYRIYDSHGTPAPLFALCDAMQSVDTAACYTKAGEVLERWYPGGRAAQCAEAPEAWRSACSG
jgi:hypothetical protein